jgi:hypothetical protein
MAQTYQPAPVVPVYQPAPVVQAYAPAPVVQPYIPPPAYQPQASYSVYNPAAVQPVVYGTPMMGAPIVVPPSNSAATASLVTGIIGIFFAFIPFIGIIIALPCAITALITAIIGMSKGSLNRIGRGPATAGLVLSIITFIMMVFGGGWLW